MLFQLPSGPSWCQPPRGRHGSGGMTMYDPRLEGTAHTAGSKRAQGRQPGWPGGPPGPGEWATKPAAGGASSAPTPQRTSSGCAARYRKSRRWPGWAAERLVDAAAHRRLRALAGRGDRQPGGTAGPCRGFRRSTCPAGRSPADANPGRGQTLPGPEPVPGPTRYRRWSAGSTTRLDCAPTRIRLGPRATANGDPLDGRPSWPMRRPASAVCAQRRSS